MAAQPATAATAEASPRKKPTVRALDGHYEIEFMGHVPQFLEVDERNDPAFSKMFNDKPGHTLLFQTTPILVGGSDRSQLH